jgi:DNA modification methylase
MVNLRLGAEWGTDQGVETMINGHLRVTLALREGDDTPVPVKFVDLSPEKEALALLIFDELTNQALKDKEKMAALMHETKPQSASLQEMLAQMAAAEGLYQGNGTGEVDEGPESQIDRAEELLKQWDVRMGQIWLIPSVSVPGQSHRLICGDSTRRVDMANLMDGATAVLCHADPPYGMGKVNEGVANDNLYRDKLNAFQMAWWRVARWFLADNAGAYIWGNAEDLWRLWYVGGLRDSERLTLRNEIVWDKGNDQGMGSDLHRMYPTASERCLFFMLGEQGFNTNADNYWDGWEPIRSYLKAERDKLGWDNRKCKVLAGHSPTSGCHWFDANQWMMPPEDVYRSWQKAARDTGFKKDYEELKKDYEELKKDFYATRAYFDNTHDNMTDVWSFPRVSGDERHDHPTPKPMAMIARILKSSSPMGAAVYDPFLGSGTTLVACEQTGRVGYGCDIEPRWIAVTLQRLQDLGLEPTLVA